MIHIPNKRMVQSDEEKKFFKVQTEELFKTIFANKKKIAFDVAFFIQKGFENWKDKHLGSSFRKYLTGLVEAGNYRDKFKTFKLAYYVACVFGDLEKEENRKVAFESYRKIANAKLFYKKSLSEEENQQKNRYWQYELRREVEGATVIRDDFEEKNLDYEAIFPKLIQKGYVTKSNCPIMEFKGLDDEFKSLFPEYSQDQFNAIEGVLKFQKIKDSKIIPSTKIPERIKEVQRKNGVYAPDAKTAETAIIVYQNVKHFVDKFNEYFDPEKGDKYRIELIE